MGVRVVVCNALVSPAVLCGLLSGVGTGDSGLGTQPRPVAGRRIAVGYEARTRTIGQFAEPRVELRADETSR
eukprot:scaffold289510_cov23-Prasinocladus_malaysianus.AAC.1